MPDQSTWPPEGIEAIDAPMDAPPVPKMPYCPRCTESKYVEARLAGLPGHYCKRCNRNFDFTQRAYIVVVCSIADKPLMFVDCGDYFQCPHCGDNHRIPKPDRMKAR